MADLRSGVGDARTDWTDDTVDGALDVASGDVGEDLGRVNYNVVLDIPYVLVLARRYLNLKTIDTLYQKPISLA